MPHPSMETLLPSWGMARPLPIASAHGLSSAGLLVAYCHRFDIQVQSSRVYFVACTIGKPTARSSTHIMASSLYTLLFSFWFSLSFSFPFVFSLFRLQIH